MFYSLARSPARTYQRPAPQVAGNQALEKFLGDTLESMSGTRSAPSASVEDGDKAYTLQLDVPGLAKDQLDIGIEGDVVRVTSKAEAARTVKAAWRFPLEIDVASSTAKLENGVLSLTLGKKVPVSNVATLTIA